MESLAAVQGGFTDPVFDAQAVFRATLDAMARPGTVADLGQRVSAPAALVPAAAALLAALADADTPVWLDAEARAAAAWLRFHTGCPIAEAPAEAAFAVLGIGCPVAFWDRFALGTADHPDQSATLVLPVTGFSGGTPLRLSGPGIESETRLAPRGLPQGFVAARAVNRARFPQGHDLVLVCDHALVALPRTTLIAEA